MLIKESERQNIDVDYLFGQVCLTEAKIDWSESWGNLAADAVVLYAVNNELSLIRLYLGVIRLLAYPTYVYINHSIQVAAYGFHLL